MDGLLMRRSAVTSLIVAAITLAGASRRRRTRCRRPGRNHLAASQDAAATDHRGQASATRWLQRRFIGPVHRAGSLGLSRRRRIRRHWPRGGRTAAGRAVESAQAEAPQRPSSRAQRLFEHQFADHGHESGMRTCRGRPCEFQTERGSARSSFDVEVPGNLEMV